jgi:hypothetical protein
MISEIFSFALFWLGGTLQPQRPEAAIHLVCAVVQHPELWDGHTVTIMSSVVASRHGVVLTGAECGKGVYISHESGKQNGKWPDFDEAIVRKATGLDDRPLRVTVRGIYHSHVSYGTTTIRQLEVLDVLDVSFAEAIPTSPSSTGK